MKPIVCTVLLVASGLGTHALATTPSADSAKSVSTAFEHSLSGTLIPAGLGGWLVIDGARGVGANEGKVALGIAIGSVGLILGPSLGHAYAERPEPMRGSWTRFAGVAIAGLGLAGKGFSESFGGDTPSGTYVIIAAGGAIWLYGTIKDLTGLRGSVSRFNRQRGFTEIRLTPVYIAHSDLFGMAISIAL